MNDCKNSATSVVLSTFLNQSSRDSSWLGTPQTVAGKAAKSLLEASLLAANCRAVAEAAAALRSKARKGISNTILAGRDLAKADMNGSSVQQCQ